MTYRFRALNCHPKFRRWCPFPVYHYLLSYFRKIRRLGGFVHTKIF